MVLWGVTGACMLVTCAVTSRTFRELSGSFDAPVLAASPPDHAGGLQKEIFGCRDQQNMWAWAADEGTKFLKFSNVTKRGHAILSYVKKEQRAKRAFTDPEMLCDYFLHFTEGITA